jgi:hypothetical protein
MDTSDVYTAIAVAFAAGFWVYVFWQNSARKRILGEISVEHAALIANQKSQPARYASQARFDRWLKIFPWEGAGILIFEPGRVQFLGETFSHKPLVFQFTPKTARVEWLGKCPFPNGVGSWVRFDDPTTKHYFSAETGIFVFGSRNSTREIYDAAIASLDAASPSTSTSQA